MEHKTEAIEVYNKGWNNSHLAEGRSKYAVKRAARKLAAQILGNCAKDLTVTDVDGNTHSATDIFVAGVIGATSYDRRHGYRNTNVA
jgi:hypothetical protein